MSFTNQSRRKRRVGMQTYDQKRVSGAVSDLINTFDPPPPPHHHHPKNPHTLVALYLLKRRYLKKLLFKKMFYHNIYDRLLFRVGRVGWRKVK